MHDQRLEDQLRGALRVNGAALPFTITEAELERRLVLRGRDRRGRRVSLLAAAVAAVSVAGIVAFGNGWVPLPAVGVGPTSTSAPTSAASEGPSATATVETARPDPLAALPGLPLIDGALDDWSIESRGEAGNEDPSLARYELDGVRLDAEWAVVRVTCLGPDARLEFGTSAVPAAVASEPLTCDGRVERLEWEVAPLQPMLDQSLVLHATPATAFRIRIQTLGMLPPSAAALPSVPPVDGPVAIDHLHDPDADAGFGQMPVDAGLVPPRGSYHASLVCIGTGSIRWEIGLDRLAGGGEQACDGIARQVETSEGVPPDPMAVLVHTEPENAWHLVVGAPGEEPSFIAPSLFAWAGPEIVDGRAATALARCVAHDGRADACGLPYLPRDGAEMVEVPVDRVIGLALSDGWQVGSVVVDAMRRDTARVDPFGPALDRIAVVDEGGPQVTTQLDALDPGDWVVRFVVTGTREDESFSGVYEIPVVIGG